MTSETPYSSPDTPRPVDLTADASIGEIFGRERRRRGKALPDVEMATRIRAKLIELIEAENWEALPSAAYVKGYIQQYARYLELDPDEMLAMYKRATGEGAPVRFAPPRTVVPPVEHAHAVPKVVWFGAVALILIAATVFGILRLTADQTPPVPRKATGAAASSAKATKKAPAAETKAAVPDVPEPEPIPFTLGVKIVAGDASWLRIEVDGLKAYEGTMQGPQTREWQVTRKANVKIGRPGAATVLRDGKAVEPSDTGDIAEVNLKAAAPKQ